MKYKRYTVYLYYHSRRDSEIYHTKCLETARLWLESADHGIIHDNHNGVVVQL